MVMREPIEQAEFWLPEIERILSEDPRNGQLAMAAALMLDAPAGSYVFRYLRPSAAAAFGFASEVELDQDAVDAANAQFDDKCAGRCVELAVRATQLDPENVDWWWLRALLQVRGNMFVRNRSPRTQNWTAVLSECASHDPGNALYDFLAAATLWDQAAEYGPGQEDRYDERLMGKGRKFFERGRAKTTCLPAPNPTLTELLLVRRSRLPTTQQWNALASGSVDLRTHVLLRSLYRGASHLAKRAIEHGNACEGLAIARQADQILAAVQASPSWLAYRLTALACRSGLLNETRDFWGLSPNTLSDVERIEIAGRQSDVQLELEVLKQAVNRIPPHPAQLPLDSLPSAVAWSFALAVALPLVLLSAAFWLAARMLGRARFQTNFRRLAAHLAAWLGGYALSFAVFGLASAEMIPRATQGWVATAALTITPAGMAIWLVLRRFRSRGPIQFTVRFLLAAMVVTAIVSAALATLQVDITRVSELPSLLHVPARG